MIDYQQTGDFVAAQKLELACRNLQHLLKIQNEQASLEAIVFSLQQSVIDAHANNPVDLEEMLVLQSRVLDAVFYYYMQNTAGTYCCDDKVDRALKAQSQIVRTINMWNKMKNAQKRGTN